MKKILLSFCILLPLSANAEGPENMKLRYEGYYGRLKAGELNVDLNYKPDGSYKYNAVVDTVGITKYVTKYWSKSETDGKFIDDKFLPSEFETTFQPKKKPTQNIVVVYSKDGVVQETATPPENRRKRPEVENKDKDNVPDPITAVLIARERIRELVESGTPLPHNFEQPVFDGRRVFLGKGQIIGFKERKINGKTQKVLHLHGQRVPYAGFLPKEIEKMKGREPVFDIYLDTNYIPVLVEGTSSLGEGTIILAEKCSGAKCG